MADKNIQPLAVITGGASGIGGIGGKASIPGGAGGASIGGIGGIGGNPGGAAGASIPGGAGGIGGIGGSPGGIGGFSSLIFNSSNDSVRLYAKSNVMSRIPLFSCHSRIWFAASGSMKRLRGRV